MLSFLGNPMKKDLKIFKKIAKAPKVKDQLNSKDERGETRLMKAALKGDTAQVKLLLKKGAKVNITNNDKQTALIHAVASSASTQKIVSIVKMLLEAGANQKAKSDALIYAIIFIKDNQKIVELLKKSGAKERKIVYTNLEKLLEEL
jgi:ankyrin repeat protein